MGSAERPNGRRTVSWFQAAVSVTVVLAIFALILALREGRDMAASSSAATMKAASSIRGTA